MERAVFGAGCFWGIEAKFREIKGVIDTQVGYAGGEKRDPSYQEVCSGATGHAEVVEVLFDPEKLTYEQLLGHFWSMHDPTSFCRQGPDIGEQYRSVIFFTSPEQERIALESRDRMIAEGSPVVTEIQPLNAFYRAEEYHQRYFEK